MTMLVFMHRLEANKYDAVMHFTLLQSASNIVIIVVIPTHTYVVAYQQYKKLTDLLGSRLTW